MMGNAGQEEQNTVARPAPISSQARYSRAVWAALITGVVIALIEAAGRIPEFYLPNPVVFLLTAVAFAAFYAGLRAAMASVIIVVVYEWMHCSDPGNLFHYTTESFYDAFIFTFVSATVAALIGRLRNQVEVAARKLAITKEREQEQARLYSLVQHLPLGLVMVDRRRKVVLSNPRAQEVLLHPAEDLDHPGIDRSFHANWTLYTPEEQPLTRALKGESVRGEDVFYVRGDGVVAILRMTAAAMHDHAGEIIGAVLTIDDVTDQKQREQAHQELAAIVRASDDAIYTLTTDGVIVTWNQGAERLFGYTADEARRMMVYALVPEEARAELGEVLSGLKLGAHQSPFHSVLIRKDRTKVAVSIRMSPLYGKNGEVTAMSAIARQLAAIPEDDLGQFAKELQEEGYDAAAVFCSGRPGLQVTVGKGVAADKSPVFLPLWELNLPANRRLVQERRFEEIWDGRPVKPPAAVSVAS